MKIGSCHWPMPGRKSKRGGRSITKSDPIPHWSGARPLTTPENMRFHEENRSNWSRIFPTLGGPNTGSGSAEELLSLQSQLSELQAQQTLNNHADLAMNSVGCARNYRQAWTLLEKAAANNVSVLLQGETGVGKEVFAHTLHLNSRRADNPFVAVNCACIPIDLIESELFGVEKGAFTGAHVSREGKFERANGGTLFLDEVVELSPRAQATLLRVLQEGELERVGGTETRKIDVRLVVSMAIYFDPPLANKIDPPFIV